MNDFEKIFTTNAIAEFDIVNIPLWNGDGWLQSRAYKNVIQGKWMEVGDQLGYLPLEDGTQLQEDIDAMFQKTAPVIQMSGYGVAFVTFIKESQRIDLLVSESGWNVGASHIYQLTGTDVSELHPKERPVTSYPIWRVDYSLVTPPTLLTLPSVPDLIIEKESFPKALW
jgi:hypothetical protein